MSNRARENVMSHVTEEVYGRLVRYRLRLKDDKTEDDRRNGLFVYLDKAFEGIVYEIYPTRESGDDFIDPIVFDHYKHFLKYATDLSKMYGSFTEDPASTKFHGAYTGGLFDHSMAVYEAAITSAPIYGIDGYNVDPIACIFHDICKVGKYNRTFEKKGDATVEKFDYNKSAPLSIGHGSESLRRLLKAGIKMSDNWELAVNYHMGVFDVSKSEMMDFSNISEKVPEVLLLHHADMIASKIYHV